MSLNTRPPTGQVPYPVVLLEGEEKSGKTWAALTLSASKRVGATYVLDLGEGSADEYGAIPGVSYDVLVHDGTYAHILEQVEAVRDEAQRAKDAGEPPVVLVIDTMTALWDGLKDWVSERARSKPSNQKKLAADPAAELDVSRNLWNDAASRHTRVLNILLRFPGIVVMIAKGKEVSSTDPSTGQPFRDGRKEYRVEGQKGLAYSATAWVRMYRTSQPVVVGARSVHAGIVPGKDDPQPITNEPENLLDWLIFEALRVDPDQAHVRDMQTVTGGALTPDEAGSDPDLNDERRITATKKLIVKEGQRLGLDLDALKAKYAEQHDGATLEAADLDALAAFAEQLERTDKNGIVHNKDGSVSKTRNTEEQRTEAGLMSNDEAKAHAELVAQTTDNEQKAERSAGTPADQDPWADVQVATPGDAA
jgi:hypothetical protein